MQIVIKEVQMILMITRMIINLEVQAGKFCFIYARAVGPLASYSTVNQTLSPCAFNATFDLNSTVIKTVRKLEVSQDHGYSLSSATLQPSTCMSPYVSLMSGLCTGR